MVTPVGVLLYAAHMVEIPEEEQVAALRSVAEIAARRNAALAEAERITGELRKAAVHAARVGAGRTRIRELAQVGPRLLYSWWEEAGIEVRTKKPPRKAG